MDLSKLDLEAAADQGATLQLRHPVTEEVLTQDDGTPITITVLGSESKKFQRAMDAFERSRSGRKQKPMARAERQRAAAAMLAEVTVGWQGIIWDGEELPCTKENAKMLYFERPFIREQVDEFVGDMGNFLKEQPKA